MPRDKSEAGRARPEDKGGRRRRRRTRYEAMREKAKSRRARLLRASTKLKWGWGSCHHLGKDANRNPLPSASQVARLAQQYQVSRPGVCEPQQCRNFTVASDVKPGLKEAVHHRDGGTRHRSGSSRCPVAQAFITTPREELKCWGSDGTKNQRNACRAQVGDGASGSHFCAIEASPILRCWGSVVQPVSGWKSSQVCREAKTKGRR